MSYIKTVGKGGGTTLEISIDRIQLHVADGDMRINDHTYGLEAMKSIEVSMDIFYLMEKELKDLQSKFPDIDCSCPEHEDIQSELNEPEDTL